MKKVSENLGERDDFQARVRQRSVVRSDQVHHTFKLLAKRKSLRKESALCQMLLMFPVKRGMRSGMAFWHLATWTLSVISATVERIMGGHYVTFPKETWTGIYSPQMGHREKTEEMMSFKSSLVTQWVCWEFVHESRRGVTYRSMDGKVSQDSPFLAWVMPQKSFIPGILLLTELAGSWAEGSFCFVDFYCLWNLG